jgi:hypothetical protein
MRLRFITAFLGLQLLFGYQDGSCCTVTTSIDDMKRLLTSHLAERPALLVVYVSRSAKGLRTITIDQSEIDLIGYTDGRYPITTETASGVLESVRSTIERYPDFAMNFVIVYDQTKLAYVLVANMVDPQPSSCPLGVTRK